MTNNRHERRKVKTLGRSRGRAELNIEPNHKVGKPYNSIQKMKFLDRVQEGAPIDLHFSTIFSDIKVGRLQFLPLYKECMETTSTTAPSWKVFRRAQRALILAQYFDYALSIPGNKAECGVFRGFSALLTNRIAQMRQTNWKGDNYHLIDSFKGLSQPDVNDAIGFSSDPTGKEIPVASHQPGAFATSLEDVRENLKDFKSLIFHKGWIPEVFKWLPEGKWSFVHIDVDLYKPTFDTLDFFYSRMAPGGIIINDDFESPLFPGGGSGWTDFFNRVNKPFVVFDSGQAVFVNDL